MEIKNIVTKRYILRKVEKEDCDGMYDILSDLEVNENLNMDLHISKQDTLDLIKDYLTEYEKGLKFPFAIIEKETDTFVGVFLIKLDLYDEDCFEFTIYLNKAHWGKGIYTEILPYMIKFAFEEIKTGNFRGFVMEKNVASSKVLSRSGFVLEKVFEVPGLEGKIESYLMTKEQYENNIKS